LQVSDGCANPYKNVQVSFIVGCNLAAIINTIPTAAWTTRPDGYCDFLNQVWLDYADMTAEQAHGWGWADAIHPDDRKKLIEEWQSCLTSGTPVDTEARIRRFDGSYRWFLIRGNPLRDESGNVLKWYGICIDIEDHKRGEEALRARELSWRQIVDNIPGLVATTGALGEVEFLNRQTLEYFGETSEKLKNWALIDVVHPDDLPQVIEARKKSIEAGQIYEIEHRCRRADGIYRWFQVRGLPVRDAQNKVTAWYLLLTDINDRKKAEEELSRAHSELAHVTRITTLNALTASIAHEIKQPLAALIINASTCLRWLNADPPNVDEARETVQRIVRAGNRASDVITRLRALYTNKEFTLEPLDLNAATQEVIALSLSDLQRNRVILKSELADGLPLVNGDRVQLQQVILNLVRNASDAMGLVDDRPRELLIRTEREGADRVCLRVKDVGHGLTPDAADKLFQAFYTTKTDGMGIGLHVSQSIIEGHHGRLWATANDGPGATFSFAIPCRAEGLRT